MAKSSISPANYIYKCIFITITKRKDKEKENLLHHFGLTGNYVAIHPYPKASDAM